jgi:hypothetical protein
MDILKVFFSFYVHPVDKKHGLVDPHGGHQFFQSARAVREIRFNWALDYRLLNL